MMFCRIWGILCHDVMNYKVGMAFPIEHVNNIKTLKEGFIVEIPTILGGEPTPIFFNNNPIPSH